MRPLPELTSRAIEALRPATLRPVAGDSPLEVMHEVEALDKAGTLADVLTVFLRGSECAFRCLMCDLWQHTYPGGTPIGSIAAQVGDALTKDCLSGHAPLSRRQRWIKLYNASNFFSAANVPAQDLDAVAEQVKVFERVVVENHPRLLNASITEFQRRIAGQLEVAMGLETVHEPTLQRLNKQLTLDDFSRACDWLLKHSIDVRTFVLLRPPGMSTAEGVEWCVRSAEFAHRLGVRHITVIPVRGGNGALEFLRSQGLFEPPTAGCLEEVMAQVIPLEDVVVTADLWDWDKLTGLTADCRVARRERLERANLLQHFGPV